MITNKKALRSSMAALFCAGFLAAGSAAAQGEIEVRSSRINSKDPNVAALRMTGSPLDRTEVTSTGKVARFPTVVLGTASYQMAGTTVTGPVARTPVNNQGRIAAVDLLPTFVTGDSLLDFPGNLAGDPTLAATLPRTATTDGVRFNRPVNSPLVGVAGPGSSPGVAGPGAFPTQGVSAPGFTRGAQTSTGVQTGVSAPAGTPVTGSRGSLRLGGRF